MGFATIFRRSTKASSILHRGLEATLKPLSFENRMLRETLG
jgi:hypothetical protein